MEENKTINNEELKLTDEQKHHIYDKLSNIDKTSTDNLNNAKKETEESNYTNNEEIKNTNNIPGVNTPENYIERDSYTHTEEDVKSVLDEYGLSNDECYQMIDLIYKYENGDKTNLYNRLPKGFKELADGILYNSLNDDAAKNVKVLNKNKVAEMLINEFINTAEFSAASNEYTSEVSNTIKDMNEEYDKMITEAVDNTFSKIDEIRVENPEEAKRLESIKNAFDESTKFKRESEFASKTSNHKFNKWINKFDNEVFYFNKRVNGNSIGIKLPDIKDLVPVIYNGLSSLYGDKYSKDDAKKFILCIIKTLRNPDEIDGIAYTYRMISTLYNYKFTKSYDENGKEIFATISRAIDSIL